MSDNGTAFMFDEMRTLYDGNDVQAVIFPPYHHTTNCQAEHYVAELKKALVQDITVPMQCRLSRFLFWQHATVHAGAGVTLAKVMSGRELPSSLHAILLPHADAAHSEPSRNMMPWKPRQAALARQFNQKWSWLLGRLLRSTEHRSRFVSRDGKTVRSHFNYL